MDGIIFVDDLSLKPKLAERWIPFALKHTRNMVNKLLIGNKLDKKKEDCSEAVR